MWYGCVFWLKSSVFIIIYSSDIQLLITFLTSDNNDGEKTVCNEGKMPRKTEFRARQDKISKILWKL